MSKISVIGICGKSMFMYVDHFHENGETLIADSVFEEVGGKGINQAIAAARMGAEVSFLCAVGDDDSARECVKTAEENGIDALFAFKKGRATPVAFILTDKSGENRVTEFKSAELSVEDVLSFKEKIISSDILLLQHEVPAEVNERAIAIAGEHGVRVILNPAPIRKISDRAADCIDIVTPNEQESQSIDIKRFKNCVTTLGSKGCRINGELTIPAFKTTAVDTTGAGDTFNGVLAVCIAEGMSMETACRYAVTASGISVGKEYVLNSIPHREDIERKMNNE